MGLVVTTNSATLVNKGLEVIEAHLLFDFPDDRIDVTVHAQSIVHSMVEFTDGSTIAQASPPDMRLPIALGMAWPHRVPDVGVPLDWTTASTWTFEPLDNRRVRRGRAGQAGRRTRRDVPGGVQCRQRAGRAVFHARSIGFLDIVDTVERVVESHTPGESSLEGVLAAERWARDAAGRALAR